MTRYQLIAALMGGMDGARVTRPDGRTGTLSSIQREDGSGHSFNLMVYIGGRLEQVYIRTID